MKRIGLIGGAGTLGSDIVASARWRGIAVLDNMSTPAVTAEWLLAHDAHLTVGDAADPLVVADWLQDSNVDVVIYLATDLAGDANASFRANVLGPAILVDALHRDSHETALISIQSFLTRDCSKPISVRSRTEAHGVYARDKLAGEQVLMRYSGPLTNMCLASVVSPRLSIGAIPAFVHRLVNGRPISVSRTVRDYLAPADFIEALGLLVAEPANKTVCVGSGRGIATMEVLSLVCAALEMPVPIDISDSAPGPGDPAVAILDSSDFHSSHGWVPRHNVEDAIRSCVSVVAGHDFEVRLHHRTDSR